MTNEIDLTRTEKECDKFNSVLDSCISDLRILRQDKSCISIESIKGLMQALTDVESKLIEKLSPLTDSLYEAYTTDLEHFVMENDQ